VSFARPAPLGSLVTAKCRILFTGKNIEMAEIVFENEDEKMIALGRHTKFVLPSSL
jgi:acyl-coenzyme A thioesterase PaaI-like protein